MGVLSWETQRWQTTTKCPLDEWREIVKAAVAGAKEGDGKARDWLGKYLIGGSPLSLTDLAADEAAQPDAEQDILVRLVRRTKDRDFLERFSAAEVEQARRLLKRLA